MSFTYEQGWTLAAPPAQVFRALTSAAELRRWFAEDASVEPHVGGVYRFWGRHTLGTPPQDAARQVIRAYEPARTLAFDWPLMDVDTDVTYTLEPRDTGTRLTVRHRASGTLPFAREAIHEHWRLAMVNLARHLTGASVAMPDYFARTRDELARAPKD